MLVIMANRPALISVTHGTPSSSSLRSKQNTPEAFGSTARIAAVHTSTTRGSRTVLPRAGVDDTPLGLWAPPKYDRRSDILASTSVPSFQRHWSEKSRPGRYSEMVKDAAGTPRISSQYLIQLRACSARFTGIAPIEPPPVRIRHQNREREPNRRNSS